MFANGGQIAVDRRAYPKNNILIASAFGIISIITRRNNVDESAASWLIEKFDKLELGNGSDSNNIENELTAAISTSSSSRNGSVEMNNVLKDEVQVKFGNETLSLDDENLETENGAKMEEKDSNNALQHLEDIFASIASDSSDPAIKSRLSTIGSELVEQHGVKMAFKNLLGDECVKKFLNPCGYQIGFCYT